MRQSADLLTSLQPRFVIEGLASTIDRRPSLSRIVRAGQGSKKKKKKSHDVAALSEIIKKPYSYLRSKMIERKKLIYIYIYMGAQWAISLRYSNILGIERLQGRANDSFESFLESSSALIKKSVAIETERATTVGRGQRRRGWRRVGFVSRDETRELEGAREEVLRVIDCVLGVASGTGKVFKVPLQGLNGAQFSFRLRRWI